jgi:hypothetical protein
MGFLRRVWKAVEVEGAGEEGKDSELRLKYGGYFQGAYLEDESTWPGDGKLNLPRVLTDPEREK